MITVQHTFGKTTKSFQDHYFEVSGVPMTNNNTIIISEALNDRTSPYGDDSFTPSPNGSSYTIAVRGLLDEEAFKDVDALESFILKKLHSCLDKLEDRRN